MQNAYNPNLHHTITQMNIIIWIENMYFCWKHLKICILHTNHAKCI